MPPFRFPGPLCQVKDWYESINDGTLARTKSPVPSVIGSPPSQGAAKSRKAIASGACAFVNPQAGGTVTAPKAAFDQLRQQSGGARISAPQPKTSQRWPDKSSSPSIEQDIEIGGQKIKLIRPTDENSRGKNLPTTDQVAEALRAVPANQRAFTNLIIISPTPAPGSTPERTIAGEGGSGEIDLYPVSKPQSQVDFDNRVMHECGHNYQAKLWTGAQAVSEWQAAATADDRRPSPYAAENTGDDFCEFIILYNTVKGTSCETIASQIYPHRWKMMQGY